MSRAFVKEPDQTAVEVPELAVSPHPNWVTESGFAELQARVAALEAERHAARAAGDAAIVARAERDLRYSRERLATARVVTPGDNTEVRFGHWVTLRGPSGIERRFRIVGEDESNPAAGCVSWVAPLARALAGARVGDVVESPSGTQLVLRIETPN